MKSKADASSGVHGILQEVIDRSAKVSEKALDCPGGTAIFKTCYCFNGCSPACQTRFPPVTRKEVRTCRELALSFSVAFGQSDTNLQRFCCTCGNILEDQMRLHIGVVWESGRTSLLLQKSFQYSTSVPYAHDHSLAGTCSQIRHSDKADVYSHSPTCGSYSRFHGTLCACSLQQYLLIYQAAYSSYLNPCQPLRRDCALVSARKIVSQG